MRQASGSTQVKPNSAKSTLSLGNFSKTPLTMRLFTFDSAIWQSVT